MTKAFDLALYIPPGANTGEAVEILTPDPVLTTKRVIYVEGAADAHVDASVPKATAAGQLMVAGPSPNFDWLASSVGVPGLPVAVAQNQIMVSGPGPAFAWDIGKAVLETVGGTLAAAANIVFTAAGALTTRLNGGDPSKSAIDNFTIDCGTY